ncbi:hypothetical protein [Citrobacter braakii]|jgi:hypothetical protein|uniref:hypothetical protein n=1 Tax=Citrobacter braakii TaxID=57706 RepID=UPI0023B2986C|nr:hypothetical protein [Citrobacter braakii]MDE9582484.1 hypothetical protein [Citrobacter braakii]HCK1023744.1 hypothetical protein [Escherichia coli]
MTEQERQEELTRTLFTRLEKVTPELFAEFLDERVGKEIKCLNCGSLDIGIPQAQVMTVGPDGSTHGAYVSFVRIESFEPRYSLLNYQYRLICKNCGFTSHYAVYPVLNWIEQEKGSF